MSAAGGQAQGDLRVRQGVRSNPAQSWHDSIYSMLIDPVFRDPANMLTNEKTPSGGGRPLVGSQEGG